MIDLVCKNCGVSYQRWPSRKSIFCSNKCSSEYFKTPVISLFDEESSESSYWKGFIFGDGSINEKGVVQVCLSNLDDGSNLRHLQKLSHYVYGKDKVNIYPTKSHLQFRDSRLIESLGSCGIVPRKTYKTELSLPVGYELDFIRGYFDADGWCCHSKSYNKIYNKHYDKYIVGICSYLKRNLEIILKYLPSVSIRKKRDQELYSMVWSSKNDILEFYNTIIGDLKLESKWAKYGRMIEHVNLGIVVQKLGAKPQ